MAVACRSKNDVVVAGLGNWVGRTQIRRGQRGRCRRRTTATAKEASAKEPSKTDANPREFETLKRNILQRTALTSMIGTGYCLLGFGSSVGASFALGTAGATLYVLLLAKSVEDYSSEKLGGFNNLGKIQGVAPKLILRVFEGSKLALWNDRLLVPVGLAVLYSAWNNWGVGEEMNGAALLLGFLSYKIGFIAQIWEDYKSSMLADSSPLQSRPSVRNVDDELDMYGNQRKPSPPE
mmetsp:Transcript_2744/g.17107  ORF Transcript_2744/g.17107 Transcript_2744/m.17107 type:complete len:236 (-) Transcript_2744:305-1012(-)